MTQSKLVPNQRYASLAGDEQIARAAQALEAKGFRVIIAASGAEASQKFFELLPAGAEVFTGSSATLEALGIPAAVDQRYDSVRVKLGKLDRATQMREMVKLGATPEYMAGSVHAITESGSVLIASATGSQLAGYAGGAAHVIWVVGAHKIVASLDEAFKRIREYTLPLEDARALQAYDMNSAINKMLIVDREVMPGRVTIIIVKENLGF